MGKTNSTQASASAAGMTAQDIFRDRRSGNDRRDLQDTTEGSFMRCRRNRTDRRKIVAEHVGNGSWWLNTNYVDFLK